MNALKLSVAAAALLVLALGLSFSGLLPEALTLGRERPLAVDFRPLELEPGEAPARAAPSEVVPASERVALATATAGEPATPELAASGETTIDARLYGQGRALSGARLVVSHAGKRLEALPSGADGLASRTFALEERALVRLELDAFGFASQEREAVCEPGRTTHLGRIELVPGGAVSGRLVDERGAGLAECSVTLGSLDVPYPDLEAARLEPPRRTVPRCTSDASGRFRLLGVPAGMVRLWAHAEGRRAAYSPPLEVRAGQESTGVELVLERLAPENLLHGLVLDPSGQPVARADIAFRHSLDGGNSVQSGSTQADAQGRFEFKLPQGALSRLIARDPAGRFGPGSAADVSNGEREVVLQLREVRRVELVVQSGGAAFLGAFALELLSADRESHLGGVERQEHPEGRCAFVLPDEPFVLAVQAAGQRVLELGPSTPRAWGRRSRARSSRCPACTASCSPARRPRPACACCCRKRSPRTWSSRRTATACASIPRCTTRPARMRRAASCSRRASRAATSCAPSPPPARRPSAGRWPSTRPSAERRSSSTSARGARSRAACASRTASIPRARSSASRAATATSARCASRATGASASRPCSPAPGASSSATGKSSEHRGRSSPPCGPTCSPSSSPRTAPCTRARRLRRRLRRRAESLPFEGRLSLDGRPAAGWAARLGPAGRLDFEGGGWTPLDSDGRFALSAPGAGEYRLTLHLRGGEHQEQFLFDDVVLHGGDAPWERELHTGSCASTAWARGRVKAGRARCTCGGARAGCSA
jgi:hypothetical protein